MPSSTLRHGSFSCGTRLAALWFGLFAGPLAWAALLQTNYVLSYVACEQRQTWMLHLAAAVALGVIASGARSSWAAAPSSGQPESPETARTDTARLRARFMATGGLLLCAWFALVVIAMDIPVLLLKPCTP